MPALFDLGEGTLSKTDLLPHLEFDLARCLEYARRVNPRLKFFQLSATRGAGLESWYGWLRSRAIS